MAISSVRQLRSRTVPLRPEGPPESNELLDDPLGIAVTGRGMADARMNWPLLGPLPDPRWVGFFQGLKERDAAIGPSVGERGSKVSEFGAGPSGTAGDELADVAGSMSGQPGSLQALALATRQQQAAKKKAADQAVNAPPPPPAPPKPGTTMSPAMYQAGMMVPGSLAALRRRTGYEGD